MYICNNMFVHFHLSTFKVWVLVHNYYVMFMNKEILLKARLLLGQNPKALVWKWRQNWTFNINIPTLNAPISTNKVFIFKLTIEDIFKNYSGLIRYKVLSLSLIKSVALFPGHPVVIY